MTSNLPTAGIRELFAASKVIPVLIIDDPARAVAVATALRDGGAGAIEITLRTSNAVTAARAIIDAQLNLAVGLGTVLTQTDLNTAVEIGADFAVSPGLSEPLVTSAQALGLPYLAGVATPSDVMRAIDCGLTLVKLYPAELAGGIKLVQQFASVFPNIRFCPTGGIDVTNLSDYLRLTNVFAVGGSWLAPQDLIEQGDWVEIQARMQAAQDSIK